MNLKDKFEIASGTVIGRDHRVAGKNNQDSFYFQATDELIAAVVCDGCGSSPHSEVGAKIGARTAVIAVQELFESRFAAKNQPCSKDEWTRFIEGIGSKIHMTLYELIKKFAEKSPENFYDKAAKIISDYFLFTIVGFVVTPFDTAIFSIGDGLYSLNGDIRQLGPFPDNAPPYLAYDLVIDRTRQCAEYEAFKFHWLIPTPEIRSMMIGTDGVADFTEVAEKNLPGRAELVGPLSQFWDNYLYFRN
ncbi:MAG: protein phosphatase 2C domain-containing protein, partial [Parcubacteria group bacterium]